MIRILVVDDEVTVTRMLHSLLLTHFTEADILTANSAAQAVSLLKRYHFDLVMTDIAMPEMNGIELLALIKDNWPDCYVIVLTAHSDFDYAYKVSMYDDVRYLLKLEEPDVIIQAVCKALGRTGRPSEEEKIREQMLKEPLSPALISTRRLLTRWLMAGDVMEPDERREISRCGLIEPGQDTLMIYAAATVHTAPYLALLAEHAVSGYSRKHISIYSESSAVILVQCAQEDQESMAHRLYEQLDALLGRLDQEDMKEAAFGITEGFLSWDRLQDVCTRLGEKTRNAGAESVSVFSEEELYRGDLHVRRESATEEIDEYIAGHYMEELSLTLLAERFHYNSSYLSRFYKQKTGCGLAEHIIRVRLKEACRLLQSTEEPVRMIAEQCGFDSMKYFTATFKRVLSMTPAQYRESMSNMSKNRPE